mgnify:CR=1 FL=1
MFKLIVVDDEKNIREFILSFDWEQIGVQPLCCFSSGEEALAFLDANSVDIILTDICMTGMDGISFIEAAKKKVPKVAIICISGYNDYEYLRSCLRLGANDYLLKPIDKDELFDAVSTVLSGKTPQKSNDFFENNLMDEQQEQNHNIKTVLDYIDRHYAECLTLEIVSEVVLLNPVYLSYLFKKIKKVNFSEYLNEIRLKRAMELLKETNLRINEVALRVGYNDARYFSTLFKRKTGMSPNEFRNK